MSIIQLSRLLKLLSIYIWFWPQVIFGAVIDSKPTRTVPDYFQTEPGPFAGPTKTGAAPFLAQTSYAPSHGLTYAPNDPLQTIVPIKDAEDGDSGAPAYNVSIFGLMGNLSPYQPSRSGFGAREYALPPGANISQVHVLHRHGSRYPNEASGTEEWAARIQEHAGEFSGDLAFLNNWTYRLGSEMLTAYGHKEMFDSGILHFINYGHLYSRSAGFVSRTTTKHRMMESAEYFLLGFFGTKWTDKVKLEAIIEDDEGFNNTLAGINNCPNALRLREIGHNATNAWKKMYLKDRTEAFKKQSGKYNWTVEDTTYAQTICPLETVALGFSSFCLLFTMEEWLGMEYAGGIQFTGNAGFSSPAGRATGIGYVMEFLARVEGHVVRDRARSTPVNRTLDGQPVTFPVNQSLYFDFGHDTSIMSVLTAFGLKQFAQFLPTTGPPEELRILSSQIVPFASRLAIEIITAPRPVSATRQDGQQPYDLDRSAKQTRYVHFVLNQRTIPLGRSFDECGSRDDGWCELETFMDIQRKGIEYADFEYSCFGDYPLPAYGEVSDGVPPDPAPLSRSFIGEPPGRFHPQVPLHQD